MRWKKVVVATMAVISLAACSQGGSVVDDELPITHNQRILEAGQTYQYRFQIHCGMEWLGEFNAKVWTTEDPIFRGSYPEDLRRFFTDGNERISPELWTRITLVSDEEILLTLPDGSGETIYHPSKEEWPGCA